VCDCQGGDSRAARARLVCVFPNHFGARTPKEWKKSYREMTTCPPVVKACRGCVSEHAHSRDCDAMCMKCARTHQKCAHALWELLGVPWLSAVSLHGRLPQRNMLLRTSRMPMHHVTASANEV
jgi:hypothetical protein